MTAMRTITIQQPPKVVCGREASAVCSEHLQQRGSQRILFVTGRKTCVFAEGIAQVLRSSGAVCDIYSEVPQEPTIRAYETALTAARHFQPDTIVGMGGGSPLDVAKLLAAFMDEPRDISQFFGIGLVEHRTVHLVCMPSTSGTGSEVSPNAILLDEGEEVKRGVISPWLVPDATFVDPHFMTSMPAMVTAGTGMDALTHCIEAYANRFAYPAIDTYALGGIQLISGNLLQAIRSPDNLDLRENVAIGSLFGGLCLGPVNTAAVHALSYPLGGRFHVPHGISNTLMLPHVLRFNLPAAPERYEQIALALGITRGATPEATALAGIERIETLAREAAIPMRLREWGVPSHSLKEMASAALGVTRLLRNNPRDVTHEDALLLYEAAY
jgi:alcohol dehydrogenase